MPRNNYQDWPYPFARPHSWDRYDEMWYVRYLELKNFKEKYGHFKAGSAKHRNKTLAYWITDQRSKKKRMPSWRKELLDEIGFVWRIREVISWEDQYDKLVEYHRIYGDCNVPFKWKPDVRLSIWVRTQLSFYRQKRLKQDRFEKLDSLGFSWKVSKPIKPIPWETNYQKLLVFKQKFGHCEVPKNFEDKRFARWVGGQRKLNNRKKLKPERKEKLEAIGFPWRLRAPTQSWEEHYQNLVSFKQKYGHCQVSSEDETTKTLGRWVGTQRKKHLRLDQTKVDLLNELGFDWKIEPGKSLVKQMKQHATSREKWWRNYHKLSSFKQHYGHLRVGQSKDQKWKPLYIWISRQRSNWQKGSLEEEQITALKKIGFDKERPRSWEENYQYLQDFKQRHGHCQVSKAEDNVLSNWVAYQRKNQANLNNDQIRKLDELDFEWVVTVRASPLRDKKLQSSWDQKWMDKFEELKKYQSVHGDCNVPPKQPTTYKLGAWVATQRLYYKRKTLSQKRIDLLNSIGFEWSRAGKRAK